MKEKLKIQAALSEVIKKHLQRAWLIFVILFMYLPILILTFYSFTKNTLIGHIRGFSLDNYVTLFTEEELLRMMGGTVVLALSVALISTVLGTVGAIGAFYSSPRVRKPLEFINEIPVVNADVVTGFSVCVFLIVLMKLDKATYIPMVFAQVSLCTPFVYLSVMPRLKQMDGSLYEAALDLGSKPAHALRNIVLPQIMPSVISGFVMAATLSLDDYFIVTYTKPASFDTISTYVVNATRGSQTRIKTALWALAAIVFLLVVIAVIVMNLNGKGERDERV